MSSKGNVHRLGSLGSLADVLGRMHGSDDVAGVAIQRLAVMHVALDRDRSRINLSHASGRSACFRHPGGALAGSNLEYRMVGNLTSLSGDFHGRESASGVLG
jgi:hypothetical protein